MKDLTGLFDPNRIAVIGATDRPGSVGRALMENLVTFDGTVIPVNPNRLKVLGIPCYATIEEISRPATIDLAIVLVPAPVVIEVVQELGECGITNVVVISAGFSEVGQAGAELEAQLRETAARFDMHLVGPNSLGIIRTANGLNATFIRGDVPKGGISLMSQSGAFISAVLAWARDHGIGFRDVISLGNEVILDEIAVIRAWGDDPETDVILAYIEDIEDGREFIETCRNVTGSTPIVAIKSGRTSAGSAAAASHTGSIAGSDQAYSAGFEQAGVIRAPGIEDAFDMGQVLATQPLLERDDIAVVTNGGGPGVLAADALDESSLDVATFDAELTATLESVLPDTADVRNPLDIIGDANLDRFQQALETVVSANTVGGVLVISVPTALFDFEELAEVIGTLREQHETPIVTCLMGGADAERASRTLATYGIRNFFEPARAIRCLEVLGTYRDVQLRSYDGPTQFEVDEARADAVFQQAHGHNRSLLGVEALDLLEAYGIPTPAGGLATSETEAIEIAERITGPFALKIVSPDLSHKSDVGGVAVNIPEHSVPEMYRTLRERAEKYDPKATILGVRIEEFIDIPESTETIVGVSRDAQFGHLLMFGMGGIFVEFFEDTAFRVTPVSEREARAMTEDVRAAPILRGARGRRPADIQAVTETIQRVSQLVTDYPQISELDINPLIVSPDGVCAVDLRATVHR